MGCVQSKKNLQIKNMVPKNYEISSVPGEIISKKDDDFGILCFDINFYGFLSTRVRLWPINSPSTPALTPDLYPDSDDSGYDCQ